MSATLKILEEADSGKTPEITQKERNSILAFAGISSVHMNLSSKGPKRVELFNGRKYSIDYIGERKTTTHYGTTGEVAFYSLYRIF